MYLPSLKRNPFTIMPASVYMMSLKTLACIVSWLVVCLKTGVSNSTWHSQKTLMSGFTYNKYLYIQTKLRMTFRFSCWKSCINWNTLTMKAPNKNWSRRHFIFLLLSFKENKAWFFMWILCLAEDSLDLSNLIFSEKQWKIFVNVVCRSRDWRFKG